MDALKKHQWLIRRAVAALDVAEAEKLAKKYSSFANSTDTECPLCEKYRWRKEQRGCEGCFLSGIYAPLCLYLVFGEMNLGEILNAIDDKETEGEKFGEAWKELQEVVGVILLEKGS